MSTEGSETGIGTARVLPIRKEQTKSWENKSRNKERAGILLILLIWLGATLVTKWYNYLYGWYVEVFSFRPYLHVGRLLMWLLFQRCNPDACMHPTTPFNRVHDHSATNIHLSCSIHATCVAMCHKPYLPYIPRYIVRPNLEPVFSKSGNRSTVWKLSITADMWFVPVHISNAPAGWRIVSSVYVSHSHLEAATFSYLNDLMCSWWSFEMPVLGLALALVPPFNERCRWCHFGSWGVRAHIFPDWETDKGNQATFTKRLLNT